MNTQPVFRTPGRSKLWISVAPAAKQLHGTAFFAFLAGTHFMRRTHWLLRAHQATERMERELCVGFAKAAHKAYLQDLKRALA